MNYDQHNLNDKRLFKPNPLLRKPKVIEPVIKINGSVKFNDEHEIENCIIGLQQDFMNVTWFFDGDKQDKRCKKINYNNFLFQD